jgi:hypothetical protein
MPSCSLTSKRTPTEKLKFPNQILLAIGTTRLCQSMTLGQNKMRRFFHIFLGAVLGGVLFGIPCFYAGHARGKDRKPNIEEMYEAYDSLLHKACTSNNPEELETVRRFSYATLNAAYFSGDTYGYKYSPEEWEQVLPALVEYELAFVRRTKTTDESIRKGIARHMDAYCRAMPFWSSTPSNRQEKVCRAVFGLYLKWYKEADKSGFDAFCLDHTTNMYVTNALSIMADLEEREKRKSPRSFVKSKNGTQQGDPSNPLSPSAQGSDGR